MKKVAVVRGKFLNRYEMQFFEPLVKKFSITAFGSLFPYHTSFSFPVVKLLSPMDLPDFPYKMSVINRLCIDAHLLFGLEKKLRGFDLVHTAETYFRYTQQCLDAKKHGYVKKVIATVLENIPFNNEGIRGRVEFKARARRELDHIIALTEKTKLSLIAEGTDPGKITVIHHYVDTRRFTPDLKKNSKAPITVLFAGRFESYKGVFDILQAARMLYNGGRSIGRRSVRWLFIGDGTRKRELQRQASSVLPAGSYEFSHAAYEQMPGIYSRADILIAPSKPRVLIRAGQTVTTWEEQYCTVLLEAQAAGLAIISTRSGGIPENVGNAAVLVQPGDARSLAVSLKQLIDSPDMRRSFGRKARERAVSHHDIRIGARALTALYDSMLNGNEDTKT